MFTLSTLQTFFGWCSVINLSILLASTLILILFKEQLVDTHNALLGLDRQNLQLLYFNFLSHFKLSIILLNIAPYFSLKLINKS